MRSSAVLPTMTVVSRRSQRLTLLTLRTWPKRHLRSPPRRQNRLKRRRSWWTRTRSQDCRRLYATAWPRSTPSPIHCGPPKGASPRCSVHRARRRSPRQRRPPQRHRCATRSAVTCPRLQTPSMSWKRASSATTRHRARPTQRQSPTWTRPSPAAWQSLTKSIPTGARRRTARTSPCGCQRRASSTTTRCDPPRAQPSLPTR